MPEIDPSRSPVHRCKHGNGWLTCDVCEKAARATAHFASEPDNTSPAATARQWIIQHCINAFRNEYEGRLPEHEFRATTL
jgi:hypothetical protein